MGPSGQAERRFFSRPRPPDDSRPGSGCVDVNLGLNPALIPAQPVADPGAGDAVALSHLGCDRVGRNQLLESRLIHGRRADTTSGSRQEGGRGAVPDDAAVAKDQDSRAADLDVVPLGNQSELHLGGEYAFLQLAPIVSLRAGVWLDPDHQISYSGDNYVADAVLTPGEDHMHFAAGVGLAFERFQLDLAADFSELVDTVSLSLIYNF